MITILFQNIEVITEDGAPSGRKDFIIWMPPLPLHGHNIRDPLFAESTGLMRYLMKRGIRVILFCKEGLLAVSLSLRLLSVIACRYEGLVKWYVKVHVSRKIVFDASTRP
jgi:ATP-dependent helicase YprA (DUF1998 family)